MNNRRIKKIAYGFYLLTCLVLLVLLFILRNEFNWIATALREFIKYGIIGVSSIFLLVTVAAYFKSKKRKIIYLGIIGITPCIFALPLFDSPFNGEINRINSKIETIELTYINWACDCANWVTKQDLEEYSENNEDSLARRSIFIEPANHSLKLPDTLGYSNDVLKFTGAFYSIKGYPKDYESFEEPEKARVFRYTNYEVIKSNYTVLRELND